MAQAANALITVEEYKKIIALDTADTNVNDFQIERLIDSASQRIESYCDRKFISPGSNASEIFTGSGTKDHYIKNRQFNDSGTNTPILSYWDGTSWIVMTVALYPRAFNDDTGRMYFTNGMKFSTIDDHYKVEHIYGWAIANVPADIKLSCAEMVKRSILKLKKAGLKSDSAGSSTIAYDQDEMSDSIRNTLQKYRVIRFG